MIMRLARSINIAFQVAFLGFSKSYKAGESKDSILGYIDSLTQLPNRRAFERDRETIDEKYALIMIDIDNLKGINDSYGPIAGDKVLKRLKSILVCVAPEKDKIYRIAGDEFLFFVPSSHVMLICNTIQKAVIKDGSFTISLGVVTCLERGMTNEVFIQADSAMRQSKKHGKNNISIVKPKTIIIS
jgi:diguanylate cyclase